MLKSHGFEPMWSRESLFDSRRFNVGNNILGLGVTCLSTSQHGMSINLSNDGKRGTTNNKEVILKQGTNGGALWKSRKG